MNIESLLDHPKDAGLDYYYQQVEFLKKGIEVAIDFSGKSSRLIILTNDLGYSSFFSRLSNIYSAPSFSKLKLLSQGVSSAYESLNFFRKDILNNIILFNDDEVSLSLEDRKIPGNNFIQLDAYEKQVSFLFNFLFKCQQIERKVHFKLKLKSAGPTQLVVEDYINTNAIMSLGSNKLISFMKSKVKDQRSSSEMLEERLKMFGLNYKSYYNFKDFLCNKEVSDSIIHGPKFSDPFLLEQLFNVLDPENSNETLLKNINSDLGHYLLKIKSQLDFFKENGIRYEV